MAKGNTNVLIDNFVVQDIIHVQVDYQVDTYIVLLKCFSPGRNIGKKFSIILKIHSVSAAKVGWATLKLVTKSKTLEIRDVQGWIASLSS